MAEGEFRTFTRSHNATGISLNLLQHSGELHFYPVNACFLGKKFCIAGFTREVWEIFLLFLDQSSDPVVRN